MAKENCWEFKKCGREPGGMNVSRFGICPATTSGKGSKMNSGQNRGRICWAVSGTFCDGEVQGTFAQKEASCLNCPFFKVVEEEEDRGFKMLLPGQTYTLRYQNEERGKGK